VISSGLDLYGLRGLPNDIRERRCNKLLKDFTFVWRTCDEVLLLFIMTHKLKAVRHGKFQHPAIISGIGKLYFGRGGQNAIGNLKPCDDVIALRDNLSAQSVIWICLGVYTALIHF
jgi:Domain of unknown function (DUF6532)